MSNSHGSTPPRSSSKHCFSRPRLLTNDFAKTCGGEQRAARRDRGVVRVMRYLCRQKVSRPAQSRSCFAFAEERPSGFLSKGRFRYSSGSHSCLLIALHASICCVVVSITIMPIQFRIVFSDIPYPRVVDCFESYITLPPRAGNDLCLR